MQMFLLCQLSVGHTIFPPRIIWLMLAWWLVNKSTLHFCSRHYRTLYPLLYSCAGSWWTACAVSTTSRPRAWTPTIERISTPSTPAPPRSSWISVRPGNIRQVRDWPDRLTGGWRPTDHFTSEYLKHARCMRDAQTEYESCVDVYQLRIKALNKVGDCTQPVRPDISHLSSYRARSPRPPRRTTTCRFSAAASSATFTAASRWWTPPAGPALRASPRSSWTECPVRWSSSTASTTSTALRCVPPSQGPAPSKLPTPPCLERLEEPGWAHPAPSVSCWLWLWSSLNYSNIFW